MSDIVTLICTLLTIAFGLFGFLAPRYTAAALDLEPTASTMGLSEMRASVGGLFVITGLFALWVGSSSVYFMLGIIYSGIALGRFVSILFDNPPLQKALLYGGVEIVMAAFLIFANKQAWSKLKS